VAGLAIDSPDAVAEFALERGVDLVVIGPEGPLVAGVANAVAAAGVRVFGPSRDAARMEGSKEFAKDVMRRHGIPAGTSAAFTEPAPALEYLSAVGAPIVIKADGLAAGKGVTVAMTLSEAEAAVRDCFSGRFGAAGSTVLIEEYLDGPECSLLAFTDGVTVRAMVPAQDHKRAYDGDTGPNTGGMGVYSPVPAVDSATLADMEALLARTVEGLRDDGILYRGVLYGGFILTSDGPKLLEYNARFGDPETQIILPLLETDLLEIMLAVADGRLRDVEALEGVTVYHAGTAIENGALVTSGGRVLNVTAVAPTLAAAQARAYEAVAKIGFDGMTFRTDIAWRAFAGDATASGDTPRTSGTA
jgi:phosphoribosylamine--glycine ligase